MSPEYVELNRYALYCESRWKDREVVDWSEAEHLLELARKVPLQERHEGVTAILAYSDQNDDWDSGYVGNWPLMCREPSIPGAV